VLAATAAGVAVTATACGSSAGLYGGAAAPKPRPTAATSILLSTHASTLGTVLAGTGGRSVYLFEADHGSTSACSDACAAYWPPVTSAGAATASGRAESALLGTIHRGDGTVQVTYAGHPLYYFSGDKAAGDVTGEGLQDFGAGWYVLSPTGHKVVRASH
jgi:predicted lipoprotein with Yx(FWY)xxD motif